MRRLSLFFLSFTIENWKKSPLSAQPYQSIVVDSFILVFKLKGSEWWWKYLVKRPKPSGNHVPLTQDCQHLLGTIFRNIFFRYVLCRRVWSCFGVWENISFPVFQVKTLPQRSRGCSTPVPLLQKMEELHLHKDKSREPDWATPSLNLSPHGQKHPDTTTFLTELCRTGVELMRSTGRSHQIGQ